MVVYTSELNHYGVLGMKWGVRRFQNRDGTLNKSGRKRYEKLSEKRLSTATRLVDTKNPKKSIKLQKRIAKYNKKITKLDQAQLDLGKKFSDSFGSMTPRQVAVYRKEHAKDRQAYLNERQKEFVKAAFNLADASKKSDRDTNLLLTMREGANLVRESGNSKNISRAEKNLEKQRIKAQKSSDEFNRANERAFGIYKDIDRTKAELNSGNYEVTTSGSGRKKKYRVRYTG